MMDAGILGLILAGGSAMRLGGVDKTLLTIDEKPMLSHVAARLASQVQTVVLSANGDPERFSSFGLPVIADDGPGGQAGPLAGVLAGMQWAMRWTTCQTMVTVAGDTPFFPVDLVTRLREAAGEGKIAVASSDKRRHPVFALWPVSLRDDLAQFLATSKTFSVSAFFDRHALATVEFPFDSTSGRRAFDPFFNINTREDLAQANEIAGQLQT